MHCGIKLSADKIKSICEQNGYVARKVSAIIPANAFTYVIEEGEERREKRVGNKKRRDRRLKLIWVAIILSVMITFFASPICEERLPIYSPQEVEALAQSYLEDKSYFQNKEIVEVRYLGHGIWQINYCPIIEPSLWPAMSPYDNSGCERCRFNEHTGTFF